MTWDFDEATVFVEVFTSLPLTLILSGLEIGCLVQHKSFSVGGTMVATAATVLGMGLDLVGSAASLSECSGLLLTVAVGSRFTVDLDGAGLGIEHL